MGVSLNPSARYTHTIGTDLVLPVTVCGWVRVDTDRNNFTSICWLGDDTSNDHAVFFACGADGTTLTLYDSNFDGDITGASMTVGTWYFVAATAAAGAGNYKLYQAVELATLALTDSATYTGTFDGESLQFGYRTSGTADSLALDGSLAYWRVWTAELSLADLQAEMASASPVRTADLWAAYAFADTATATTDASGNGRTLTLTTGGGSVADTGDPTLDGGVVEPVNTASRTSAAQSVTGAKARSVGTATRAGEPQPAEASKTRGLVPAGGASTAHPVSGGKSRAVSTATRTCAAHTVVPAKSRVMGVATRPGAAQAILAGKARTLAPAARVASALTVDASFSRLVGTASRSAAASTVGRVKSRGVAAAERVAIASTLVGEEPPWVSPPVGVARGSGVALLERATAPATTARTCTPATASRNP